MPITRRQRTIGFKAVKNIRPSPALKNAVEANELEAKVSVSKTRVDSPPRKIVDLLEPCVTPSTALSSLSIDSPNISFGLSKARRAFHSSSSELPCREKELATLHKFIFSNLRNETSGSMYISGLPGTGKTACLSQIILKDEVVGKCHIVFINCTSIKSSGAIYLRICEALKIKVTIRSEKVAQTAIEKYLSRKHKMVLLILDEIDQLESKYQSVLYTIFEWPSLKNSRLLLVGIANAVDLTDRLLPRLAASVVHQPILLHFRPYTKEEICTILKHRLTEAGESEIFAPGALELISAKVAVQSGDVRRALDLGRRVLEISRDTEGNTPRTTPQRQLFCTRQDSPVRRSPRKQEVFSPDKATIEIRDDSRKSRTTPCSTPERVAYNGSPSSNCTTPLKMAENFISPQKRRTSQLITSVCSPGKRVRENDSSEKSLKSPRRRALFDCLSPSKRFLSSSDISPERSFSKETNAVPMRTPIKLLTTPVKGSPKKIVDLVRGEKENALRRSPRKLSQQEQNVESERFSVHARDVLSVVNQMYGTARNLNNQQPSFPLHQKLLICSLMLIIRKGRRKDINIGKLHEVYGRVCKRRGLTAVDQSGFVSMCRQVEMTGAVEIGKGPPRLAKISLQWDETEVARALQDTSLLAAILEDTASLGK